MRNETVEIVDSKGQKMRLKISTPSFFGTLRDGAGGYYKDITAGLTGWKGKAKVFKSQNSGNWKVITQGFIRYHAGIVLRTTDEATPTITTKTLYLVNIEGTWGMKFFNYEDMLGVNDAGEGTAAVTWVTNLAEGRFSWSIV